ncbi:MAG: hypothetical protein VX641_03715, partial [Planctomycetota bacterium]|nr:hypothetical protein [Planctomycetota bacterium]
IARVETHHGRFYGTFHEAFEIDWVWNASLSRSGSRCDPTNASILVRIVAIVPTSSPARPVVFIQRVA